MPHSTSPFAVAWQHTLRWAAPAGHDGTLPVSWLTDIDISPVVPSDSVFPPQAAAPASAKATRRRRRVSRLVGRMLPPRWSLRCAEADGAKGRDQNGESGSEAHDARTRAACGDSGKACRNWLAAARASATRPSAHSDA